MGCASSKRVEATVAADKYNPPPTSIALFDINNIEEPWLMTTNATSTIVVGEEQQEEDIKKPTNLTLPLLEKLDSYELTPRSWSEVSKALEDLKPSLLRKDLPVDTKKQQHQQEEQLLQKQQQQKQPQQLQKQQEQKQPPQQLQNSHSIHTLRDLDTKLSSSPKSKQQPPALGVAGYRPVKENSFILRDRQERENKSKSDEAKIRWKRRDPLEGYPDGCPPGNPDGVVLYTTTLRGVRRTFDDCERARSFLEANAVDVGVDIDERDVSLHGDFRKEVKELAGEGASVPRLFIRGKYVGGVEEVVELSENGKLREMMRSVVVRGGGGELRRGCEGCGGVRFVPCMECNGSCKVLAEDGKEVLRCGKCNENGLVLCPLCHSLVR